MGKKIVSGTMLTLLLIGIVIMAFDIQPVKASGTIWIRSDGSVDPDTAPISSVDNITYTFIDNIYDTIVVERSSIIIDGNEYTLQGSGSGSGFALRSTNNVTIKRTKIEGFGVGIEIFEYSYSNTISGNNITNNGCGIWLIEYCHNNTISGNNITQNNYHGIFLADSSFSTISGNNITQNNWYGIELSWHSCHNTISGNTITQNNDFGIGLFEYSCYNTISGNTITQNNDFGIGLFEYSCYNTISGNTITQNNYHGISLWRYSEHNSIVENKITNNSCGIYLVNSYSNTISGNSITQNNGDGILLASCSFGTISGNTITQNNDFGIRLHDSSFGTISENIITSNRYGIMLYRCPYHTISGNIITSNGCGIWLDDSSFGTISENIITSNGCGIWLVISSNKIIYHNNFVDNTEQVYSYGSTNVWDDGYPSGGNYWSDYSIRYPTVVDDYHGENQDILGGDGMWDSPYVIEVDNQDRYPFVNPLFLDMIPPVADAGPDQIVHEDTPVILNGEASFDNVGIVGYVWRFIDVTPQTLTGVNPTYTFQTPGIYIVTLNVTDASGNWDTDEVGITVLDVTNPVADAGPDQTIDEDTEVTFDGSGSTDNVGVISWTWTFTDVTPQTLTGVNPTYTFTAPGIYTVTLEVSDAAGNHATDTVTIIVLSLAPEDLMRRLIETIETWNLPEGTETSLTLKLEEAIHLLNKGNDNGAIHKLMDFINQVEALRGMKLTIEKADYLISEAQRIIDLIKG